MFNISSSLFGVAARALNSALGDDAVFLARDTTPHHMRRGNGQRITGFSGDLIRQMNRTNGVGAPTKAMREQKASFIREISGDAI